MDRRLLRPALALTGALAVCGALVAGAPASSLAAGPARLQGSFQMSGRVTAADGVLGEHVGERVSRTWAFSSSCPSGQCPAVLLVRRRANATDELVLHRRRPGRYQGSGVFLAALRCAGRTYRPGEMVPFTITVRITGATVRGGVTVARSISATYANAGRVNLTPCVGVLGHDAASYRGSLVS